MGLHLLLFTQLFLKVKPSASKAANTETEFGMKKSLKVILGHSFCNQLQCRMRLFIPIYNNAGIICKVSEEVATKVD